MKAAARGSGAGSFGRGHFSRLEVHVSEERGRQPLAPHDSPELGGVTNGPVISPEPDDPLGLFAIDARDLLKLQRVGEIDSDLVHCASIFLVRDG